MAIRYSKDPQVDRTLRHSVRDGMAYSVMSGGGETYFSAFALFLKATTPQIGLLATLPPLLGSLAQLLAVWLGARMLHRLPVILAGATLQAFVLLPLLILPLVYRDQAIHILVACVTLLCRCQPRHAAVDQPDGRAGPGTQAGSLLRAPCWCSAAVCSGPCCRAHCPTR
jgi:hypothetical protein